MQSRNTYECPLSSWRTLKSWRSLGPLQSLSKVVYIMDAGFSVFTIELCRCFLISCHGAGTRRWRYVCDTCKRSSQVEDGSWPILEKFIGDEEIGSEKQIAFLILSFLFSRPRNVSVPALCSVTENLAGCFCLGCWAVMLLLACEINYLQPKSAVHRSLSEEAEKQFTAWLCSVCLSVTLSV